MSTSSTPVLSDSLNGSQCTERGPNRLSLDWLHAGFGKKGEVWYVSGEGSGDKDWGVSVSLIGRDDSDMSCPGNSET